MAWFSSQESPWSTTLDSMDPGPTAYRWGPTLILMKNSKLIHFQLMLVQIDKFIQKFLNFIDPSRLQKNIKFKLPALLSGCIVFICTCFAWIFFRANGIHEAFLAIEKISQFSFQDQLPDIFNTNELLFACSLILLLVFSETFIRKSIFKNHVSLIAISFILILLSYLFGEFNYKEFIYFQF